MTIDPAAPTSNSDVCPVARSRCVAAPAAMASSRPSRIWAGWPNELSAPTLASDSSTLRFVESQVDPPAEVADRPERPFRLARRDDRLDRPLADVLDRQQPEPDRLVLDRELDLASADVRRPDLDAQPAALGDRRGDLLLVVPERGQDGRHVVDREVRLEVRGLVGDQAVAGGVGLVEAVPLERLERGEDLVDRPRAATPRSAARVTNFSFWARRTVDFFFRIA